MKKKTFKIMTRGGAKELLIEGMTYKKCFWIHKSIEDDDQKKKRYCWVLAHAASGRSIKTKLTIKKAKEIANGLLSLKVDWNKKNPDLEGKKDLIRQLLGEKAYFQIKEDRPLYSFWPYKYFIHKGRRYKVPSDEEIMNMSRTGYHYTLKGNYCDPDGRTNPDGTPSWYCALGLY